MAGKLSDRYAVGETSIAGHRNEILDLWQQFDDDVPGPDKLDWLYLDNPEGPGTAYGIRYLPDDFIAGIMCFSRRELVFAGQRLDGALVADTIIDKAHRSLGPYWLLSEKGINLALEQYEILFSFPRVTARTPGLGENHERDIDFLDNVLPLDIGHYLERVLPKPLAALGGVIASPYIRLPNALARRRLANAYSKCDVDADFVNTLWSDVKDLERLQGERSADFVFWRLSQTPFAHDCLIGIVDVDGRPAAYAVTKQSDSNSMLVIDLCWRDLEAANAILRYLVQEALAMRSVSIILKCPACYSSFIELINGIGFRERRKRTLRIMARPSMKPATGSDAIWIQPLDNDYI